MIDVESLVEMLTYCRPAFSDTEEEFIDTFLRPLGIHEDAFGNIWKEVGTNPNILWSSHTDTVHWTPGRQEITINAGGMLVLKHPKVKTCLGADDTVGVWMMIEMIKADIPGLYVFHRDEEMGGGGSSYIAKHHPEFFKGIDFAIALDRKGYGDVITHQGGRCCSDDFARQLGHMLDMVPSHQGIFTDTANYTSLVRECTNISVGYFNQHGPLECLDVRFAVNLLRKLLTTDFSVLRVGKTFNYFIQDNSDLVATFLEMNGFCQEDIEEWM